MHTRRLTLSCLSVFLGFSLHLAAVDAPASVAKPGYNVMVEVTYNEEGVPEDAVVIKSDDMTGDQVLNQIAAHMCANLPKLKPVMKDGKAIKQKQRAPYFFPVEDDEGPAANNAPRPALRTGERPKIPEALASKGQNGGVILELNIGSFGNVQNVKVLRASHQEYADSAVAALKTWIFVPASKDGVNVESRWRIAIGFSVDGADVDWKWRLAPRPSLGGYTVVRPIAPAAGTAPAATEGPLNAAPTSAVPAK